MRRSAAPSIKGTSSKRIKFCAPFKAANTINNTSHIAGKFGLSLKTSKQEHYKAENKSVSPDHENLKLCSKIDNNNERNCMMNLSTNISFESLSVENNGMINSENSISSQLTFVDDIKKEKIENKDTATYSSSKIISCKTKFLLPEKNKNFVDEKTLNRPSLIMKNTNKTEFLEKISSNSVVLKTVLLNSKFLPPTANKLGNVSTSQSNKENKEVENNTPENYYSVVWCKASSKKHKKWEGDGVLITKGKCAILKDLEGKQIAKGSGYKSTELLSMVDGSTLLIGGKEIEVQSELSKEVYLSGKCFSEAGTYPTEQNHANILCKQDTPKPFVPYCSSVKKNMVLATPRHDPNKEGALVMPRPKLQKEGVVDVVVDPFISHDLRPHQREGILFLYECVMGMRESIGNGAILADEMGLGKTLQCISLVWTLLKQGPYGVPVVKKVVIVTPGSLVKNWYKEFIKWLGSERIVPFAVDGKNRVDEYILHPKAPVLLISYEMFLRCLKDIQKIKFDLIICDEAHRLKNANIKTAMAISNLAVARRVLLTGTPIQNNLQEFYTLAEIANPGVLGSLSGFKRVFVEPIMNSQQPGCKEEDRQLGKNRAEELNRLTSLFCLRRTGEINKAYLPPKVEYVLFVKMSSLQLKLYNRFLSSRWVRSCLTHSYSGSKHLICIGALKKVCNDPKLIYRMIQSKMDNNEDDTMYSELLPLFSEDFATSNKHVQHSAKLFVVETLLHHFILAQEKIVIVSNSTKTLAIIEDLCNSLNYKNVRLDGQTAVQVRQQIVDRFNDRTSNISVFLLSSKAGGVGLNLTGASKLILYDIDWNPANDIQAMARVWRDGQRKDVHIYRILISGSIEEKMYQRQIIKQGLSGTIVDSLKTEKAEFSTEDLKDLFTYKDSETCCTHELLQCPCTETVVDPSTSVTSQKWTQPGEHPKNQKHVSMSQLMCWQHIHNVTENHKLEEGLRACKNVSFVFRNKSA